LARFTAIHWDDHMITKTPMVL